MINLGYRIWQFFVPPRTSDNFEEYDNSWEEFCRCPHYTVYIQIPKYKWKQNQKKKGAFRNRFLFPNEN